MVGRANGNMWSCAVDENLFAEAPASVAFYGHEIDLTGDEATLSGRVDGSVRRAIRKAEKEGVAVEVSGHARSHAVEFYGLLCQTRRKHGMPPQPFHFFRNVHEHVLSKKLGVVVTARFEGRADCERGLFWLGYARDL